ncbi:MAG TPA: ABC transporter permease [Candidatus Hydrogenedentes bacterium]|nr:ABC transporter permease [Candidatus Hydrogenedentota bacterium]HPG67345.1 ABC transporter permease [Candidatus Hydrogenedentota bacterium]
MITYIMRRLLIMIPTLLIISVITFAVIQLPPGDYLTTYLANLADTGEVADQAVIESLRRQYGLDKPLHVQYFIWISGFVRGDFGQSFSTNKPVNELIWERLALTITISFVTLVLTWIIAIPIGIFSAVRQYTVFDYVFTFLGFVGMSVPGFLLALVLMSVSYTYLGTTPGGLFSEEYIEAAWSIAKVGDLCKHLWVPVVILSVAGTAGLIRQVRANLLDQLEMPYVVTARSKGLAELRLLLKYPVRVAVNPIVSTLGWMLPGLFSGSVIVAMVLNLPTVGPLLLRALMDQDMFLAGSIIMILSTLTVIGTLISDILLAWVDPRIRFERRQA